MPSHALVPDVSRIAVLRANAIGDMIFTLPALDALRAAYPDAEIVLLARPWHAGFFRDRPGPVDRVVVVPPYDGLWVPEGAHHDEEVIDAFFARMAGERFDLALQLHGGGRYSNPFVSRLGARVTAGFRSEDAMPLDRWVRYVYWQHEIARYLEIAHLVGAPVVNIDPSVTVLDRDRDEADQALDDVASFVVLNAGATDERRRWPAERFAAVGDALAGAGYEVVVVGDAGDRPLASAVVGAMRKPARSVAGELSLGGLAAVLERASLVVSNDTGPLHLARAVGTATVGIYWCGNMVNAGPLWAGLHRTAISWRLTCPRCGAQCMRYGMDVGCDHRESFVADVAVDAVLEPALDLLELLDS